MEVRLVYIIPLMAILYLTYVNFAGFTGLNSSSISADSDSNVYFIDVGDQDTSGHATFQGPFERVSESFNRDNVTYRLIEKDMVYFGTKVKQNTGRVKVELKFIDTIPEGYELKVGLKNKKEWSYIWQPVYNPFYRYLNIFNLTGEDKNFRIYSLKDNLTMPVSSFMDSPPDAVIATAVSEELNKRPGVTYRASNSSIKELRGDHTFYVYIKGNLSISVKKQDLNSYIGSDDLEIKLYSQTNTLIKNITILDDGNAGKNTVRGNLQKGVLEAFLDEGVYKVTMKGGSDILIRNIELNQGNIMVQNPFLAGVLYTSATRYNLYTHTPDGDRLGFLTYHTEGLQTVNISSGNYTRSLNITAVNTWHYIDLPPGKELYRIEIPRGDIIVNAKNYFSFTNDSYFTSSSVKILRLQNSMEWLKENMVDYVIVPNQKIIEEGNWTIASAEFNLTDAYIENDSLNFIISASHLQNSNSSIPLDWIKIYMEK